MLIIQHHGTQTPVEYKHVVNPIKTASGFEPNWSEIRKIRATSKFNGVDKIFEDVQSRGSVIIINEAGGWCTLTFGMKILQGKELVKK